MARLAVSLVLLGLASCVRAHMSIYVPSMWGSEPSNINSNQACQPLENYDFNDWWFHGPKSVNDPPPAGNITQLPAGGSLDFEITGNKAFTSMGRGLWVAAPGLNPRDPPVPWSNDMHGGSANIHAPQHADVAGCALGIAYKSNIGDVKPDDFVIFSVVHDCIARQLQVFEVPALPACPNGKCICAWFWIHKSVGGTDQMYMTGFQCNVTNPSKRVIGTPTPPIRCDGQPTCYLYPNWGNKTTGCKKTLQPMYWANNQGNNMYQPVNWQCAPTYSDEYGFPDGAQHQIFVDGLEAPKGSLGDTLISNKEVNTLFSSPYTLLTSPLYKTALYVLEDGEVILSDLTTGKVLWTTGTAGVKGVAPYTLKMQHDGNLVLADSKATVFWSTNTANAGSCAPYKLRLRDNTSPLNIVDCNGTPVWTAI